MCELKVSIMIPTYNRAHYLVNAIESAIAQDYDNLEILVSDNASTDNTGEVIKKYIGDKRFKYFRNDTNIGTFGNWIRLLYEYATGNYGAFLPDDDYFINPKHITEAVSLIEKNKVNYIITDSIFDDEVRGIKKEVNLDIPEYLTVDWAVENIGVRLKDNIPFSPGLPSVFSIKRAKELNVLYPQTPGSDGEMGIRFMFDGPSAYMESPQRFGRGHKSSEGNMVKMDDSFEGLAIYNRIYEFGKNRNYDLKKLLKFKRRNMVLWITNIVVPPYLKLYGASYRKFCLFLAGYRDKYKIDLVAYIMMILSEQVIGRFMFNKNKLIYKYLRNIYWIIKYGKIYPKEYETKNDNGQT